MQSAHSELPVLQLLIRVCRIFPRKINQGNGEIIFTAKTNIRFLNEVKLRLLY
jgi:hypothetical protein